MSDKSSNPPPYAIEGAPSGPPAVGYAPQPDGGYALQPAGGYALQPAGNYIPLNQYPAQQAYQPPPQPYPQQYLAPAPAPAPAASASAATSSTTSVIVNNVDNRPTGLCVVCGKGQIKDKPTIWTWILAILALPFCIVPGVIVFLYCCRRPTCTNCGHKE